jgi:hypothetical protein
MTDAMEVAFLVSRRGRPCRPALGETIAPVIRDGRI